MWRGLVVTRRARTARRTRARTSSTCAIPGRATSGLPPTSPLCREPDEYEVDLRARQGRRSAAATATSRRSWRSPCRRKTTSRSGGCRSPTAGTGRARSRSPATRRSCWPVPRTTSRTRPSASCSSRPSTTRRAPGCCSAAGRARADESPASGRSTCSASTAALAAPSNGRRTARSSSAADARPPIPIALDGRALSGTTGRGARSRSRPLRERVRLAPGAFVRVTFATGVARGSRHGAGARRASTATAAPRRGRSRWRSRTCTSRCSTSA